MINSNGSNLLLHYIAIVDLGTYEIIILQSITYGNSYLATGPVDEDNNYSLTSDMILNLFYVVCSIEFAEIEDNVSELHNQIIAFVSSADLEEIKCVKFTRILKSHPFDESDNHNSVNYYDYCVLEVIFLIMVMCVPD